MRLNADINGKNQISLMYNQRFSIRNPLIFSFDGENVTSFNRPFVHLPTWLGFLLTNQIKMDHSNAAGTCLYDIHDCAWSLELITAAGIDFAKLPPLARGYELLGGLENAELIAEGLTRGLPVAVGAGDTACTALGLGVREHGQAFISFGTSSVITAISNKSLFDPRITARSFIFEQTWALAGAMSCTGASLKWFRNALCDGISFETMTKSRRTRGLRRAVSWTATRHITSWSRS